MNDTQAERMVHLLEEIRDGQRLQLERQAQALQRQEELLAQQRERLAGLSQRSGQAGQILEKSAKVVASARVLVFIVLPFVVLLLGFLVWVLFARVHPQARRGRVMRWQSAVLTLTMDAKTKNPVRRVMMRLISRMVQRALDKDLSALADYVERLAA